MRTLIVLVLIGWLLQQPWTPFLVVGTVFLVVGLLAWTWVQYWELQAAPRTWMRVEPHFDEPQTRDQEPSDHLLLLRKIEELEADLKEARREADTLRAANQCLERDFEKAKAHQTPNRPNPLFRRVGLDESAPEWVVVAVRRAYRKRRHPDAHPQGRKMEAERRFKEAEQVFDEVWRLRGFQS